MDSQSRGRDIYLAMSPSGNAITPEFCSKNPYAIALGFDPKPSSLTQNPSRKEPLSKDFAGVRIPTLGLGVGCFYFACLSQMAKCKRKRPHNR